jgi:membrane associated rhomboid family serine protease
MGLADRYYMRDTYHPPRMTTRLIVVLICAFIAQSLLLFYGDFELANQLALSVDGIAHGKIWQLLTFQFLHTVPWPWHVLVNCLGIYFFGRPVEEMLGARKFLALYLTSGAAGGILQVLLTLVLPRHVDQSVVGASAGVCGMIAIFCSVHPMDEITTWIYFFPITIRAKYFLYALLVFSVFGTLVPFGGIAHAAHLGGILLGLAYVRFGKRFSEDLPALPWPFRRKQSAPAPGSRAKHSKWRRVLPAEQQAEDHLAREVDRILDKISAQGLNSLSDKERKLLETARRQMRSK